MKTTEEFQSYINALISMIRIQENAIEVKKKRIKQQEEKYDLTLMYIRSIYDFIASEDESKKKEGMLHLSNLAYPNKVTEQAFEELFTLRNGNEQ